MSRNQIVPGNGGGGIGSFAAAPLGVLGGAAGAGAWWLLRPGAAVIVAVSVLAVAAVLAGCWRVAR